MENLPSNKITAVLVGDKFVPPFRVGKKQKRVVLDSLGHEAAIFQEGFEQMATDYVKYLNAKNKIIYSQLNP